MSNASAIVLAAVAIVAAIYVLCLTVADWPDEKLASLPVESKAAVVGVLSLLLWYEAYLVWNSCGVPRSSARTTVGLVLPFLLLFALCLWQARKS